MGCVGGKGMGMRDGRLCLPAGREGGRCARVKKGWRDAVECMGNEGWKDGQCLAWRRGGVGCGQAAASD